jgi:hypothetical protein
VELLGFVMPKDEANTAAHEYISLSDVPVIADSFEPGEKFGAGEVVVRA